MESGSAGHRASSKLGRINDKLWLNPLVKLRDEGVSRQLVEDQLLVLFFGGNLPGDSFCGR